MKVEKMIEYLRQPCNSWGNIPMFDGAVAEQIARELEKQNRVLCGSRGCCNNDNGYCKIPREELRGSCI